jgi:hypothetical protein
MVPRVESKMLLSIWNKMNISILKYSDRNNVITLEAACLQANDGIRDCLRRLQVGSLSTSNREAGIGGDQLLAKAIEGCHVERRGRASYAVFREEQLGREKDVDLRIGSVAENPRQDKQRKTTFRPASAAAPEKVVSGIGAADRPTRCDHVGGKRRDGRMHPFIWPPGARGEEEQHTKTEGGEAGCAVPASDPLHGRLRGMHRLYLITTNPVEIIE